MRVLGPSPSIESAWLTTGMASESGQVVRRCCLMDRRAGRAAAGAVWMYEEAKRERAAGSEVEEFAREFVRR